MTTKAGDGHLRPPKVPAVQGETRPAPQGAGAGAGAGALTGPSAPASCLRSGLCLLSSREEPAGQSVPPMPRCPHPCNDGCPPSPTVSAQPEVRAKSPHPRIRPGKAMDSERPGQQRKRPQPCELCWAHKRVAEISREGDCRLLHDEFRAPHTHTHIRTRRATASPAVGNYGPWREQSLPCPRTPRARLFWALHGRALGLSPRPLPLPPPSSLWPWLPHSPGMYIQLSRSFSHCICPGSIPASLRARTASALCPLRGWRTSSDLEENGTGKQRGARQLHLSRASLAEVSPAPRPESEQAPAGGAGTEAPSAGRNLPCRCRKGTPRSSAPRSLRRHIYLPFDTSRSQKVH